MASDQLAALLRRVPKGAPYRRYLTASHSFNTKRAYEGDVEHFRRWGGKIPSTAMQLAGYLAAFAGRLAFATLRRRVAGIHREHVVRGFRSPAASQLVKATLRGIARTYACKQRQMHALLRPHLLRMLPLLRGPLGARDKALLLTGFFGGFRRSELVSLNTTDIRFGTAAVFLTVRRSKTDQEGVGRVVKIPKIDGRLCPFRALKTWLRYRPANAVAVFTSFTHLGRPTTRRLTGAGVAEVVKHRVRQIGLEAWHFSGHSLRAGFVTSAAKAGAATWQIRQQTGHKSEAVVAAYIRDGGNTGANVARLIAGR